MDALFYFPERAKFGRKISKETIYKNAKPNAKVKSYFISDIEKIEWSYKLSPRTINIPCRKYPKEIQIFTVFLKNKRIREEVLTAIDKTIPSAVIFVLRYRRKVCYALTYKRINEADEGKRVISRYFISDWLPESTGTMSLPTVLDLSKLYEKLICEILSLLPRENESIKSLVERAELRKQKELEKEKVGVKLKKERQFNRKTELNSTIKKLEKEIKILGDM